MSYEIINGIKVEIFKRKVNAMRIKIENSGRVSIITPLGFPKSRAIAFFNEKFESVKKALNKFKNIHLDFSFRDGDEFYLFGEKLVLKIEKSTKLRYRINENQFILKVKKGDISTVKNSFFKVLSEILLERAKPLFEKWTKQTGFKHNQVRIHKTVSRWGSCNVRTANINLSVYLANLPLYCLDYVILHELCHLKHANHGDAFKNLLYSYMPYWKTIKDYMRDTGNKLRLVD